MKNTKGLILENLETRTFLTDASDYAQHNGKSVKLVRELSFGKDGEIDEEVAPMFLVKLETGEEIQAYPDEVLTDKGTATMFLSLLKDMTKLEGERELDEEEREKYNDYINFIELMNVEIPFTVNKEAV